MQHMHATHIYIPPFLPRKCSATMHACIVTDSQCHTDASWPCMCKMRSCASNRGVPVRIALRVGVTFPDSIESRCCCCCCCCCCGMIDRGGLRWGMGLGGLLIARSVSCVGAGVAAMLLSESDWSVVGPFITTIVLSESVCCTP